MCPYYMEKRNMWIELDAFKRCLTIIWFTLNHFQYLMIIYRQIVIYYAYRLSLR